MKARNIITRGSKVSKIARHRYSLDPITTPLCNSLLDKGIGWHSFSTERSTLESLSKKTDDLLHYLASETDGSNKSVTLIHFDDAMLEWAEVCNPEASQRAEQLLMALEANYDRMLTDPQHSTVLLPNSISYNHVLQAYAQSNGGTKAALKCDTILDRMLARCQRNNGALDDIQQPEPLVTTFNTCMKSWSKSKDPNAGTNAERIFRKMERWNYDVQNAGQSKCKGAQPNTRSLAIVLDCWAKSHHEQAYDRILATFYHAIDKLSDIKGDEGRNGINSYRIPVIPLNTVVFNSVLNGLANSSRGVEAGAKAREIVAIMEDLNANGVLQKYVKSHSSDSEEEGIAETTPNTTTWSLLLKCWTNAVDAADDDGGKFAASQAEAILDKMEELYETKPNAFTYTSCLKAWSKCSSESGAKRALSILERMERLFEESKDKEFKPNSIHYNTCLSAFSQLKSKDAVNQARELFARMQKKGVIDTVSYNTMMKIYLTSSPINAHVQVELLYKQMQAEDVHPDTITFNTMMDSLGKSGEADATQKVIELLNHMIGLSKRDANFTPSAESFTVVLNAIAQSQIDEKVEPGRKIFHELLSMHEARSDDKMKPDVRLFAVFISTCANQGGSSERKRFALKLALGTYEQLCKQPSYGAPNSFIYGGLMKACGRLASDQKEKSRLMEHIFNKCIEDGQLSKVTFDKFLKGAPRNLKENILGGLPSKKLPFEWYRNVKVHERP